MIKYTKEKFQKLKAEYLKHIENTSDNPTGFIAEQMRRFGPIDNQTKEYIMLMLLDDADRDTLSELLVYLHYTDIGRNILVETPKGYIGENSECRARSFNDSIRQRADRFNEYRRQLENKENKKLRKKINKQNNQAAVIRKAIRTLENEIKNLGEQIAKKERQIANYDQRLEEVNSSIAELQETLYSSILPVTKGTNNPQKAFKAKWDGINREDMTDEQLTAFIEDCFTLYETTGFADTLRSPYSDQSDYNGRPFKVIRRATAEECDVESMPQWVVKIEGNDDEVFCFPEEICKLERK